MYTFRCRRIDRFGTDACCSPATPRTGVAVRRARRQQRHAGRRESRLEAGAVLPDSRRWRCSTAMTASASRAPREHPEFDPFNRFHYARERGSAVCSATRCWLCHAASVRAPARQQRPAVAADDAPREPAVDAEREAFAGAMVPGAPAADAPVPGSRDRSLAAESVPANSSICWCSLRYPRDGS